MTDKAIQSAAIYPITERFLERAQTTKRTSNWLSDSEFRQLAQEVFLLAQDRARLIEIVEQANMRATE